MKRYALVLALLFIVVSGAFGAVTPVKLDPVGKFARVYRTFRNCLAPVYHHFRSAFYELPLVPYNIPTKREFEALLENTIPGFEVPLRDREWTAIRNMLLRTQDTEVVRSMLESFVEHREGLPRRIAAYLRQSGMASSNPTRLISGWLGESCMARVKAVYEDFPRHWRIVPQIARVHGGTTGRRENAYHVDYGRRIIRIRMDPSEFPFPVLLSLAIMHVEMDRFSGAFHNELVELVRGRLRGSLERLHSEAERDRMIEKGIRLILERTRFYEAYKVYSKLIERESVFRVSFWENPNFGNARRPNNLEITHMSRFLNAHYNFGFTEDELTLLGTEPAFDLVTQLRRIRQEQEAQASRARQQAQAAANPQTPNTDEPPEPRPRLSWLRFWNWNWSRLWRWRGNNQQPPE